MADVVAIKSITGGVAEAVAHDSAAAHVTGRAVYIDDMAELPGTLHVQTGMSARAHAKILGMDLDAVRAAPGVVAVLTAADIPGINDASPIAGDDPIFAEGIAQYIGQPLFAVAARSYLEARAAVKLAQVEYQDLEPILDIDQAMAAENFVLPTREMARGDATAAIAASPHRLAGEIEIGGQDHFYLETQIAYAVPGEGRDMLIYSSTQHPSEVQHNAARALGVALNAVTVEIRRMGGGFGGKESHPALIASTAAIVARATGRPAKYRLDRDDDMMMTGKRHDFRIGYEVGFDDEGRIGGITFEQAARCGYSADLSASICDRAMFHADNGYYLDHVRIRSYRCKTNTQSNTAFRGFGGPQGMVGIERVMDEIAFALGRDPLAVRRANFYGDAGRNVTQYGMTVEDNILPDLVAELERSSDYGARREAIRAQNATNRWLKKGIALTPVKFGISFTATHLNQAGALVHVYKDGSVALTHGGTEMGQGLYVKVAQVVAEIFQIDLCRVKITATTTGKVPNTSATAASSGSDLNGHAARDGALKIRRRLAGFAAEKFGVAPGAVIFQAGRIRAGDQEISFDDLVGQAYLSRVQLSATGFYKTPKVGYDPKTYRGRPFFYFSYGAAVSEVVIDTLTGEYRTARVDILHDCGQSLNPAIDMGQIEGGFIQGLGWLTTEELWFDKTGRLCTHAPSTYKIPAVGDRPDDMRMAIYARGRNREETVYRSKAVGEPPLMLAISVLSALGDAVAAAADHKVFPRLDAPATPERVLLAIEAVRREVSP
ncbi:Xanthine dehydrogenase, molybdenum binding subunit [hydrothermal vent metagenome]|uniref:Xanthine dehydrogenase, molybdenum binding subunit n=1 Tax=hydrothermal vent metagenome TaxID=652676 RepID=A0A3B0TW62_9ZZZZ